MVSKRESWQCLQPGVFYGQQNEADALSELLKVTDTLFKASARITADVDVAKYAQNQRPEHEMAWPHAQLCSNQRSTSYDYHMRIQRSRVSGYAHDVDYQNNVHSESTCGVSVDFLHYPPPGLAPQVLNQTHGACWECQPQNNCNITGKHERLSSDAIRAVVAQSKAMHSSHGHYGSHHASQHSTCGYPHEQTWSTTCSPHTSNHLGNFKSRSPQHSYDSTLYTENDINNVASDSDVEMDPLMATAFAGRSGYGHDVKEEVLIGPTHMIGSPASIDELVLPPAGCGVDLSNGVDATQGRKLRSSNTVCALSDVIWLSKIAEFDLDRTKVAPISFGSIVHLSSSYSKNCRPCIFEKRPGRCVRGKNCEFCHIHVGQKYRSLLSCKSDRGMDHHASPGTLVEKSWTVYQ
eukprot:TRINITY_DN20669_c0_g1_i3.p1 TRINITY_DN20669_c0_g1~~TRINITY_DN20669_c0_g1_i3.p1  ORF type:complete len:425 (-),score=30.64 TRINITY_DN20669_c0_g1_i3:159-1379(-)